jgi:hypothetical protein
MSTADRSRPRGRPASQAVNDGSDYTPDEIEFMLAVDKYKREQRRPHPTWSEVLEVLRGLGYAKSRDVYPND